MACGRYRSLQALLQNSFGRPFHVGLPQLGFIHTGPERNILSVSTEALDGATPEVGDTGSGCDSGGLNEAKHLELQKSVVLPFHVGLPQPGAMQVSSFSSSSGGGVTGSSKGVTPVVLVGNASPDGICSGSVCRIRSDS